MRLNAKQIALATGGDFIVEPIDASEVLTSVSLDSREVESGSLYVAIQGARVDGHDFIEPALMAGAGAVLVSEPVSEPCKLLARELGAAIIAVPNTPHAVADIASAWRDHLSAKVIAVTGSVGKTTTKNLIRDVVSSRFKTCATRGNQNNELGGPLTLLSADPTDEVIVMEMGMDGAGQIQALCRMARPDQGVITNVGESHIEMLGSQENIARAKAELLAELPEGVGCAFLNAQDAFTPFLEEVSHLHVRKVRTCLYDQGDAEGKLSHLSQDADQLAWAEDIQLDGEGRPRFILCLKGFRDEANAGPTLFDLEPDVERVSVHLALRGEHNVANALAAATVGRGLGIEPALIARALGSSVPEAGRQEMLQSREGYLVINDAYNASPDSMRASLALLASMNVVGERVAVLGDMGELGDHSDACHSGVGTAVAEYGMDRLVCVGQQSRLIAEGAQAAGMDPARIVCVETIGAALEELEGSLSSSDAVLVKASNFMGLTRLAEGLIS